MTLKLPKLARPILLVGLFGLPLELLLAQTPLPVLAPSGSKSPLLMDGGAFGDPVPAGQVARLEEALEIKARREAMDIAATYARSGALPGVREFGNQLMSEIGGPGKKFDFNGVVSRNPAFWQAERELAVQDVSLPYLISMLSILSRDYVTASRMLALAQATLPLTPTVRRGYASPEAMLLYLDGMFVVGLPTATRMETVEQCERGAAIARTRIGRWSNRPALVRALIELEVRRVELLVAEGRNTELLEDHVRDRLRLTPEDLAFLRTNDPILATGLDATVRQWLDRTTLAQRWAKWAELSEPAEEDEVAESVNACVAGGRFELAWLTWRHELLLRGVANPHEAQRWKGWCERLLDPPSAAYVEKVTAANGRAGMASMPIREEDFGEGWSGDQRIHPFLVVKVERKLALIDVMLSLTRAGTRTEAAYRMERAQQLADIAAVEGSRAELRRARAIVGDHVGIKITEAQLLSLERHYREADQLYEELLRDPKMKMLRRNYSSCLFMEGNYRHAHDLYAAMAREHPEDSYRAIMSELAARRLGGHEFEILRAALGRLKSGKWPAAGLRYLQGELDQDGLMGEARRGTIFEIASNECEASLWIAEVALAEGRKDDGIAWLHRCIGSGYTVLMEYKIALAELERIEEPQENKPRKSAPPDSGSRIPT